LKRVQRKENTLSGRKKYQVLHNVPLITLSKIALSFKSKDSAPEYIKKIYENESLKMSKLISFLCASEMFAIKSRGTFFCVRSTTRNSLWITVGRFEIYFINAFRFKKKVNGSKTWSLLLAKPFELSVTALLRDLNVEDQKLIFMVTTLKTLQMFHILFKFHLIVNPLLIPDPRNLK
jgi:hypothetical protein